MSKRAKKTGNSKITLLIIILVALVIILGGLFALKILKNKPAEETAEPIVEEVKEEPKVQIVNCKCSYCNN